MPDFDLAASTAIITGAASGIGRATALALGLRGCGLALVDRDAAGLAAVAAEAEALGVVVSQHVMDVSDADDVAALPGAVIAHHGSANVLVNNAGVSLIGRFDEVSMDEVRWLFEINVFAVMGLTKAVLPHFQRQPEAHIVNISSLFGLIAPADQSVYAASKFAVRGFSESLRHELEGSGVGVTVVHPGGVRTNIAKSARKAVGAPASAEKQSAAFDRIFLTTPPEQVGDAIVKAITRRAPRLVVAKGAKGGEWLARLFPARYWRLMRGLMARTVAR